MDVFELRLHLDEDYARYTRSFIKIADPRIAGRVHQALNDDALWPSPLASISRAPRLPRCSHRSIDAWASAIYPSGNHLEAASMGLRQNLRLCAAKTCIENWPPDRARPAFIDGPRYA